MTDFIRTRWAAVGAAVAVTLGAGGVSLTQAALDESPRPVYVSLDTPCRAADTRPASQIGPKDTPIAAGEANAYEVQITGEAGDCADETGAAVPDDAVGVALNVTVIAPSAPSGRSYFTVYPGDSPLPGTSSLNFVDGQAPFPNKVDVGLSADGTIKIFNFDGTAHVAVDIFGYYIDHVHDDRYYTEDEIDEALNARDDVEAGIDGTDLSGAVDENDVVFATVTVDTPTSGYVIVNSSVQLHAPLGAAGARCSITTGTTIDTNAEQRASAADQLTSNMISGTRGFQINKALPSSTDEITINLVCDATSGSPALRDPYLTAIFVPDPDAFDQGSS